MPLSLLLVTAKAGTERERTKAIQTAKQTNFFIPHSFFLIYLQIIVKDEKIFKSFI